MINNIYENKFIKSDEHMAELLADVEYSNMPNVLLQENKYCDGTDIIRFFPKTDKYDACIIVGIQNFEILETEQYKYSLEHFIQLIRKIMTHIKDTGLAKYDEQLRKIIMSHEGVTERLEKYEQLIRKYESYIAEKQTESE